MTLILYTLIAPKALFEQGEKADAGSRKKSVRLDIDIYILYITFVWLFERLVEVRVAGFDL